MPEPSNEEKLSYLRRAIEEGDRAIPEGRTAPAEDVFERLERKLKDERGPTPPDALK